MTLRFILVIVLRFYAISLAVQALSFLPILAIRVGSLDNFAVSMLMEMVSFLIISVLIWCIAGRLANAIVRGIDGNITFSLTLEEACTFAFVFLGLYFILNGIGPVLVNFFDLLRMDGPRLLGDRFQVRLIQQFAESGVGVIFGFASVLGARSWARKIARRASPPAD
jgi:hypothetical protein